MSNHDSQYVFIVESNRIERIFREPTKQEITEFDRFLNLEKITIKDLKKFVSIYAPGHIIRDRTTLNVSVGGYYAPFGGKKIITRLQEILDNMDQNGAYKTHVQYELLHAFTDGNGRSGRALWAWQMFKKNGCLPDIGFLHSFYYQTLSNARV